MAKLEHVYELINKAENADSLFELKKMIIDLVAEDVDQGLNTLLLQELIGDYNGLIDQLKRRMEEVKMLSTIDSLTGIYNRMKFMDVLTYEINKAKRSHEQLGIIMFDIDHFKQVNDTYGHDVGDMVLKTLSRVVLDMVRPYDTFARWGGEEFMVLVPMINLEDLVLKAEGIREKVAAWPFSHGEPITISLGVTLYQSPESTATLLKRVDLALYDAKDSGRNCVKSG